MDKIIINGGKPLEGTVKISGAKNAVLPMMAAALMVDGISTITRVPNLRDTRTMIRLMEIIGAKVSFKNGTLTVDGSTVNNPEAPYDLVKTMRASFYVLGPLIARFGEVKVSLPGGCAWGPRPVDYHLKGLEELGAKVTLDSGYILAESPKLQGKTIRFEYPSVGATGNIAMAAVTANGTTIIENAAREPEIEQLCLFMNKMGADISGVGTDELTITGVKQLHPADIEVIPDRVEAGTFLMAGAALGEVTVQDVVPKHLKAVLSKLEETGAKIEIKGDAVTVTKAENLAPVDMTTAVFPGFPTDLQAQWVALMMLANGSSVVTDTVYHDRFSHVPELNRLGANIHLENNVAIIRGVKKLLGASVMSTDIRASASLINAGLMAEGQTDLSRIYHIDRGYENIEAKYRALGADISRISE
ncbi:MAG: UDP-N-acetylglucosamine 1-carboxyvinyltransferase [Candidatus Marinimicrobia bacterium]|jgi:UDP-N-acetylglucosamine 1-carboxyvinyltransferase|nr:UDP-N-acetylglucosamine 1-carboxyvinyltransferase [Candidatus Neomarinimicrobiota bacterium]MBT3495855.1 UDP-N-acetylglucosamine 1-carboxyvinyltransferase [Candidatus Neomarinimicrobiota bacterium]MBT3692853.1 UDP-N-acetylglucosamine 1-carboxyvinyltransferase [Candidatus Neomarinimicrobiota bacterium]MBT4144308.1 UDP-N-acetylglucosamine 1-carboxyvinyltransferase [Candidatus Neomarinimicrobiota bacterium]MBT4177047.1 UDP-N-acetylglucosamine 1-carboxyvinyltransferase [Candidatus Neomarinimicro